VKYRAVLFDAGNTLLGLDHERIAPAVAQALGIVLRAEQLRSASPHAALAMEEGKGTDQERALRYLELLFERAGVPRTRMAEVKTLLWDLHAEHHLWTGVDPGTAPALGRLREALGRLSSNKFPPERESRSNVHSGDRPLEADLVEEIAR